MPYCEQCGHEVSPAARRCPSCGATREPRATGERKKGVSWLVIGLGCGVALLVFGGIVAAVFIPNLADALQKARQKRTLADLQAVSGALESYREEHDGRLPEATSIDELAAALEPEYLSEVPRTDAWDHPVVFSCWSEGSAQGEGGCDTYRLISPGRDGVLEEEDPAAYEVEALEPAAYDRDLVVGDGYVYRYPGDGS